MQSWRCMRLCVKADLEDNMHACMPACQQQYVGPFSPLTAVHAEKTTSPQLLAGRALPTLSLATINPYTQSVACCQLTVNLGQQQQHHHHQQQQQESRQWHHWRAGMEWHLVCNDSDIAKSASVTGPSEQEEGGTAEQVTTANYKNDAVKPATTEYFPFVACLQILNSSMSRFQIAGMI
ncbi:hypothetical protein T02_3134 [Trichinella nativa]|uniref:Uncharacterized protein n=1 Tax=Trichinella nativa TaxID=6335 RepID=A0A0V1LFU9_9BILA|nr:hypothetical protein T02_3134 [Trichinella nativa]